MISLDYLKYTPCEQQADQFYFMHMYMAISSAEA